MKEEIILSVVKSFTAEKKLNVHFSMDVRFADLLIEAFYCAASDNEVFSRVLDVVHARLHKEDRVIHVKSGDGPVS